MDEPLRIVLCERSQPQRLTGCVLHSFARHWGFNGGTLDSHSYEMSRTGKSIETDSRVGFARGCKRGERLLLEPGSLQADENMLESDRGGGHVTSWMY